MAAPLTGVEGVCPPDAPMQDGLHVGRLRLKAQFCAVSDRKKFPLFSVSLFVNQPRKQSASKHLAFE
jgi:hypothetical protein